MHAYASTDPVFLAMNARGQRETGGALGDFCVRCHAPMALREGLTTDGANLAELPAHVQGVTCFFCHSAADVEGDHNAPIVLADDGVMRGGIDDPVPNEAHRSAHSPFLDRTDLRSADLCGSCHDIVTDTGVHLERTFAEWRGSLYAGDDPLVRQTCGNCHMPGKNDVAAEHEGVFLRRTHDHMMAGVDVALTDFPDREAQRERTQRLLNTSVFPSMCVLSQGERTRITATLENLSVGHAWPSGAAHDRRVWVEVVAYDEADNVVFHSGHVPEGTPLVDVEAADPQLWRLGDRIYDDEDREVHMFWEARRVESEVLAAPVVNDRDDPRWVDIHRSAEFNVDIPRPARVTMQAHVRPMGLDILDDLIATGDLSADVRGEMPTFTLAGSFLEWRAEDLVLCVPVDHAL